MYMLERKDKERKRRREEINKRGNFVSYEVHDRSIIAIGPGETDLALTILGRRG